MRPVPEASFPNPSASENAQSGGLLHALHLLSDTQLHAHYQKLSSDVFFLRRAGHREALRAIDASYEAVINELYQRRKRK